MKRLIYVLLSLLLFAASARSFAIEQVVYYHNDIFGNPVAATDSAGAVAWKESYAPYGDRMKNQAGDNRLWFQAKSSDPESGLSYFGARYYDPAVGRFMGMDPSGFDENNVHSFNRYAYGNNNPYKYKDPDGQIAETILDVVSLGFSIAAFKEDPSILNGLGLAYDAIATATPFLPAGFGIVKNAGRAADALGDAAKGVGEASSLANAARLRGQLAGQEIAGGHAFEKHVLVQGEFKGLGIRTREQFASHIENVVNNPTASRQLSGGRTAYWQDASGTVVIRNPRAADGGTAFQPPNGRAFFDGLR